MFGVAGMTKISLLIAKQLPDTFGNLITGRRSLNKVMLGPQGLLAYSRVAGGRRNCHILVPKRDFKVKKKKWISWIKGY